MEFAVEDIQKYAVQYGMPLVGALACLFAGWVVSGWVGSVMRRTLEKREFDKTLTRFFANLVRYAILTGVVLGVLGMFGIETTSFAAVIGAAGLAIGLAFQGTLSNFAAGIMLIIFRPFKVNDYISVGGNDGFVEMIELFTTELKTLDNRRLILPNSKVFGEVIDNMTHHPIRRVDINVGTDYGADLKQTRDILEKAAKGVEGMINDPAPEVFLAELGDSSINWQVRIWCNTENYWSVWQATILSVKTALDAANIGIPYPQMDVHLDK